MKINQKGFSPILVLIGIVLIIGIVFISSWAKPRLNESVIQNSPNSTDSNLRSVKPSTVDEKENRVTEGNCSDIPYFRRSYILDRLGHRVIKADGWEIQTFAAGSEPTSSKFVICSLADNSRKEFIYQGGGSINTLFVYKDKLYFKTEHCCAATDFIALGEGVGLYNIDLLTGEVSDLRNTPIYNTLYEKNNSDNSHFSAQNIGASPDGSHYAYSTHTIGDTSGKVEIYVYNLQNNTQTLLKSSNNLGNFCGSWNDMGDKITILSPCGKKVKNLNWMLNKKSSCQF